MHLVSKAVTFTSSGVWTPPADLHSLEVIVRGGGGGGSTGNATLSFWTNGYTDAEGNYIVSSGNSQLNYPGAGGGGGGLTMSRGLLRAEEITEPVPITVGAGGLGATTSPSTIRFVPGGNGEDSSFGKFFMAGGGLGGGRSTVWENQTGTTFGGPGGYAPIRGGQGGTYQTAALIDSRNETGAISGGGGGGQGQGRYETDGDEYGNTTTTVYPWRQGGAAGPQLTVGGNGGNAPNNPQHWEYLFSGCGGNGGGGNGGFPSGGGGGGNAETVSGGKVNGGNGAKGCVTVIEFYMVLD